MDDLLDERMGTLPDTSSLPRTMDGFEFYLNLIDFHMWDIYKSMFFRQSDNQDPPESVISGGLAKAWYREYVYGKVFAPMDQTVIVHNERRYSITRVR